jgi:predicted DNA-binding transcriptional regulator AlpA
MSATSDRILSVHELMAGGRVGRITFEGMSRSVAYRLLRRRGHKAMPSTIRESDVERWLRTEGLEYVVGAEPP